MNSESHEPSQFPSPPDLQVADLFRQALDAADAPTVVSPVHSQPDFLEAAGGFIGPYQLLEVLGEGGFGVVWRAEQKAPIHREVALKVIKPGMDSCEIVARFEAERQALAMMDHPHIASVLDAGATAAGRPYFVMELVKGSPITRYCDDHKLGIRERLELFIPVCLAVQHAHQKAVLHRDLKPTNVLVEETDGRPVPKVIDFGIAKALGAATEPTLKGSLLQTMEGIIVGTPLYMSPEQAGSVPDVDTRSDIYMLGVVLYELLTGVTPITRECLKDAAFDQVLRLIREGEAKRPSSRFTPVSEVTAQLAAARQAEPQKLNRALRGDVDWIVLKALEKDRNRRYSTAGELAADLQRHLRNEPVSAGPPSARYRLMKLIHRNKATVTAAVLVFFALAVGAGIATWSYLEEKRAKEAAIASEARANLEATRSKRVADFLASAFGGMNTSVLQGRDTTVLRDLLKDVNKRRRSQLADDPEINARVAYVLATRMEIIAGTQDRIDSYTEALELLREVGLGETIEASDCLFWIATFQGEIKDKGHYSRIAQDRLALFEQALAIRRRLLEPGDWRIIQSLINYSSQLTVVGRAVEAEETMNEALFLARRANDQNYLGWALQTKSGQHLRAGELELAERAAKESLEARLRIPTTPLSSGSYSTGNRSIADAWSWLAAVYQRKGDFKLEEEAQRESLRHWKQLLGYERSGSLRQLGRVLLDQRKFDEAEAVLRRAIQISDEKEHQPYIADLTNLVVRLFRARGDTLAEEQFLREAVSRLSKGKQEDFQVALERLAECLCARKKHADAMMHLKQLIELKKKLSEPDHEGASLLERKVPRVLLLAAAHEGEHSEARQEWLSQFQVEAKRLQESGILSGEALFTYQAGDVWLLALEGKCQEAANLLLSGSATDANGLLSLDAATLFLSVGDADGYNRLLPRILERIVATKNSYEATRLAYVVALAPGKHEDFAKVMSLLEKYPARSTRLRAIGMLHLRLGNFTQSEALLRELLTTDKAVFYKCVGFYRAIALHHLGKDDEARATFYEAKEALDEHIAPAYERLDMSVDFRHVLLFKLAMVEARTALKIAD